MLKIGKATSVVFVVVIIVLFIYSESCLCSVKNDNHMESINEIVTNYKQNKNILYLEESIHALSGFDCQSLVQFIQNDELDVLVRFFLIDLFKNQPLCSTIDPVIVLFDNLNNAFLKSKIAGVLGDAARKNELPKLIKRYQQYEHEKKILWDKAKKYEKLLVWTETINEMPEWSYEAREFASNRRIPDVDADVETLWKKLESVYDILFNLHESLWQLEALIQKEKFDHLDELSKRKYLTRHMNDGNRYVRQFLLDYLTNLKDKKRIELIHNMWDPADIIFTKIYLRSIREDDNIDTFLYDQIGNLFDSYHLKEEMPAVSQDTGGIQFVHGWQVSIIVNDVLSKLKNFGNIRHNLLQYIEEHPNYPAKTILLSLLYERILQARLESDGPDITEKNTRKLLNEIRKNPEEQQTVREKAKEILDDY